MLLKMIKITGLFKFSFLLLVLSSSSLFAAEPVSSDVNTLYRQGLALRKENRFEAALSHWEKGISINPDHVPTLISLTELNHFLGHFQKTLDYGIRAMNLTQGNADLCYYVGTTLSYVGKSDQAVDVLLKGYELDPSRIDFLFQIAEIESARGNIRTARSWLEKILKKDPKNFAAAYQIGMSWKAEEKSREAKKWFEKALKWNPEFTPALFSMGLIFIEEKNWKEARAYLEKVISIDKVHPRAFFYLSLLERQDNRDIKEYNWLKRAEPYMTKVSEEKHLIQKRRRELEIKYRLNPDQMGLFTEYDFPVFLGDSKEKAVQLLGSPGFQKENFLNYPKKNLSLQLKNSKVIQIHFSHPFNAKIHGIRTGTKAAELEAQYGFPWKREGEKWTYQFKNEYVTFEIKEGKINKIILSREF